MADGGGHSDSWICFLPSHPHWFHGSQLAGFVTTDKHKEGFSAPLTDGEDPKSSDLSITESGGEYCGTTEDTETESTKELREVLQDDSEQQCVRGSAAVLNVNTGCAHSSLYRLPAIVALTN